MDENKYGIFTVSGGIGKSIMSTAVIRAIKKEYPERNIIVISGHEPPFTWNNNIYRTYVYGQTPFFYDNYIKDKDVKLFALEPYQSESHILQQKHLTETWCDLYNIKHDGVNPELILNPRITEIVKDKVKLQGKPLMLIQTNGGSVEQISKKSWARDIPIEQAQIIANHFNKIGYRILHLRREDQPKLENTEWLSLPISELFHIIPFIKKSLLMDSFMQHAFAAFNKKSTVCWISNSPAIFGYDIHDNILPKSKILYNYNTVSFLEKFDFTGNMPYQFPYDNVNVFNIDEIISSIIMQ